ncbi:MAG: PAS domain S-box protein [Actinomycetota bacterium]|nr:PAS domain S-box protein [Actinomycetota bacterium]
MPALENPQWAFREEGAGRDGVAESLRETLFVIDLHGRFVSVPPVLAGLAGIIPEEMVGRSLEDLLPRDRHGTAAIIRERLDVGKEYQADWELTDEDGTPVFLRVHLSPWRKGGEVVGALGMAYDVTDEVGSERELERKALLMRLQMDVLEGLARAEGITEIMRVIVDKSLEALGIEAGCLAALYPSERGWLARQIVQQGWSLGEARVAKWRELSEGDLGRRLDGGEIFALREREGPGEWLEPFISPSILVTPILTSPRGAFVLMLVSNEYREWREMEREFLTGLMSIAERELHRAELLGNLRRWEDGYLELLESASDAIAVMENERIAYANPPMVRLIGFPSPEDVVGLKLENILSISSLEELRERVKGMGLVPRRVRINLLRQGEEYEAEVEITSIPLASRRAYQLMVKDLKDPVNGDLPVGFDFISRLSHDFRTPLSSVMGYIHYLGKVLEADGRPQVEESLGGLRRGVKRLSRLVDNMLNLAKSRAQPEQGWAYPSQVIGEVLEDLRDVVHDQGVEVVVPGELPCVPVLEGELQEIFQNLITNAVRAVSGVESPKVEVGYRFKGDSHIFSVSDSGVGIPDEHQEDIFLPLFRLVSGDEGSGLGLSIVRQILRVRGGDIWVRSHLGKGTTFYFSIPD